MDGIQMRCTHSWMVPPESLLPNSQSVVQQVGCLLIFILIPGRTEVNGVRQKEASTDGQNHRQAHKEKNHKLHYMLSSSLFHVTWFKQFLHGSHSQSNIS